MKCRNDFIDSFCGKQTKNRNFLQEAAQVCYVFCPLFPQIRHPCTPHVCTHVIGSKVYFHFLLNLLLLLTFIFSAYVRNGSRMYWICKNKNASRVAWTRKKKFWRIILRSGGSRLSLTCPNTENYQNQRHRHPRKSGTRCETTSLG